MSSAASQRTVSCYFGILNLGGLMDMRDNVSLNVRTHSEVECPIFASSAYTIKTTFNQNLKFKNTGGNTKHFGTLHFTDSTNSLEGRYYQKKFRREVLWDFGDGTKVQGYSAEHSYKKPGRYKITCTLFDINRRAWTNNYQVYVVVKEVIPTVLNFNKEYTKSQIYCSKIERICRIEAMLNNRMLYAIPFKASRIFSEEEHEQKYQEIGQQFGLLNQTTFKHMDKYWDFMNNEQVLFYNSDKIHSNNLKPTAYFTPNYVTLYGRFFYEEANEALGISESRLNLAIYQIIPYKHIDDNLKTITLLNPNVSVLDGKEEYITYNITQLYREEQLPEDVFYLGSRGFCDVFYKNDFIGNTNVLNFCYDTDNINIDADFNNTPNYLNINPIGINVNVKPNNVQNVKIALTCDGFLHTIDDEKWDESNGCLVDSYLYNSLFKGLDLDIYMFPYICYDDEFYIEGADDLVIDLTEAGMENNNKMYYVPKDLEIDLKYVPVIDKSKGNSSYVNHGLPDDLDDYDSLAEHISNYIIGIHPWFYRIPVVLQDYIDIVFDVELNNNYSNISVKRVAELVKFDLKSSGNILVPRERQSKINLPKILDVYMAHPMFKETANLREMMQAYLGNGMLQSIVTNVDNFIDNTSNIKTCYLSNFISMLKMMGEDVTEFEKSSFDGVNDMKNFVRLLSMNHSDLVGHVIKEPYDISISGEAKGKHVGDEIYVTDTLLLNSQGKITSINRNGVNHNIDYEEGCDIIVCDRYTNFTKIVNLSKKKGTSALQIGEYKDSWDWNLLLPINYDNKLTVMETIQNKISNSEEKLNDNRYSTSQKERIRNDIANLKKQKADLIEGYYRFFLLNPNRDDKRVGNFMEEFFINDRINDSDDWDKEWGVKHEILMKILIDNCYLKNNRTIGGIYADGEQTPGDEPEYVTDGKIKYKGFIGEDIPYMLIVNNEINGTMDVRGQVSITGKLSEGKNQIVVSLANGIVDDYVTFSLTGEKIDLRVNYDGTIIPYVNDFTIHGNNIYGKLHIEISGTAEEPLVTTSLTLDFQDERRNNVIVFNNTNTIYTINPHYFSNLMLQDKTVGNSSFTDNKKFKVDLKFLNKVQIGQNACILSAQIGLGEVAYTRSNGIKTVIDVSDEELSPHVKFEDIPAVVILDTDGTVRFKEGDIQLQIDKPNFKGNVTINLSGNGILGNHTLNCVASNIIFKLVQIGGYSFVLSEHMDNSEFIVNGQDVTGSEYRCYIDSVGQVVTTAVENKEVTVTCAIKVVNNKGETIHSSIVERIRKASVDEYGNIIEQFYSINDGSVYVVIDVNAGYYEVIGYRINL